MNQRFRCAIYTRKSTDEGLDRTFNSLDAQREACEAYIKSQQHEGWQAIASHYDDGNYSGGNMERPALRQIMADKTEPKTLSPKHGRRSAVITVNREREVKHSNARNTQMPETLKCRATHRDRV